MKKSFSPNKIRKNNRGVAVIFTLGILGLLTVMALGFASTALLNRKIADNTSSAEYARHIAKNIALARAQWVVKSNLIADSAYSSGPVSGESSAEDFLHKMDTVPDDVELYRITNDSGAIQNNTARWQYVKAPDGKILGRYAYAIVPDSGHLDPVGNRGQTSLAGRFGRSEKEIGVYSLCNGDAGLGLSENPNAGDVAGIKFRTFKEFTAAFSALSSDNKKNFLKDGYRIQRAPSPDAFWIDTNQDGKKTNDELYLRFNMPTSSEAWATVSVDQLIGKDVSDVTAGKYTSGNASIDFIPWLKYWTHSNGTTWTADLMKKQIAANIIQYNLPGPDDPTPHKTISDKMDDSDDWLTAPPTYAGIGRHPMLNEIGFSIRVKADVSANQISADPERWEYEPKYIITVENGVELINPFTLTPSAKCHVKFSNALEINIMLRTFKEDLSSVTISGDDDLKTLFYEKESGWFGLQQSLKLLNLQIKTDTVAQQLKRITSGMISGEHDPEDAGTPANITGGWTSFDFSREFNPGDWSSQYAYTKADSFWKTGQTKTVTFKKFAFDGENRSEKIKANMKLYKITGRLGDAVLYYGEDSSIANQRDFAKLSSKTDSKSTEVNFSYSTWGDLMSNAGGGREISGAAWLGLYSVQAKDPLVNHYASDWSDVTYADSDYDDTNPADVQKINKLYAETGTGKINGTVFDTDGSAGDDAHHCNNGISDSFPLKDTENSVEVTLESATDPACTGTGRLSSSYIRHAPMRSLWELGFISRAEAFKTLNLARTRVFDAGTAYDARGGGTFAQGDANLLDQIKFSDTTNSKDAQGKININARYHKVFEWVFNKDASTSTGTAVNWYNNLITGTATDPYNTETPVEGTTKKVVCNDDSGTPCLSQQHANINDCANCLAHLLMERSRILPFGNRAELLLDPDYPNATSPDIAKIPGYSTLSSTDQEKLKTLQRKLRNYLLNPGNENTNEAKSKLVREQYAARFMNLLKADADEHIYVIVLAQSIKDIGGVPAFVDWDGNGEYTPASGTAPTLQAEAKFLRTGFVRKKLDGTNACEIINPSSGTAPSLNETITTTTVGTYDYGADKITGEAKLIAEMIKDEITGKWKTIGLRYVE